jgi:hypothetical protein
MKENKMKMFLKILPVILCFLLSAAHFGRANLLILQIISILIPFLLFWKTKIAATIIQACLLLAGIEWIRTTIYYARIRIENGEPWLRLAIILGSVAVLNFATILIFRTKSMKARYKL